MRFWFSKKKNSSERNDNTEKKDDEIYKAILKNREAIGALEKKQAQVEKRIKQLEIEAKLNVDQNRMNSAKILLKRKKLYEQEIENILNNKLTLEDNMINLENMHLHKIAVNALSYSANTHKKMNNEINVQKVEKIIDNIQEIRDTQEEINQALNFNALNNIDDDEITEQLNLLKEQSIQEKLTAKVNDIKEVPLATVPDNVKEKVKDNAKEAETVNEESDEEELKELIEELA